MTIREYLKSLPDNYIYYLQCIEWNTGNLDLEYSYCSLIGWFKNDCVLERGHQAGYLQFYDEEINEFSDINIIEGLDTKIVIIKEMF